MRNVLYDVFECINMCINIMYLKKRYRALEYHHLGFIEPTHVSSLSKRSRDTSQDEREQAYRCMQLCPPSLQLWDVTESHRLATGRTKVETLVAPCL